MEKMTENTTAVQPLLRRGLNRIPGWLKNKYFLAGSFFIIWMTFFDQKDLASDVDHWKHLQELKKSEKHFSELISNTQKELNLLKTNAQTIEKYAREKYLMKKDNEDIFIVNSENPDR